VHAQLEATVDERTKNWHAAMERAVERFQEERAQWPEAAPAPQTDPAEPGGTAMRAENQADAFREQRDLALKVEVDEVDEQVFRDLASKHSDVKCPIHGTAPRFELDGGAVRQWFCCDTLLRIIRELSARDAA
jgi:hypothetical protein